MARAQRLALEGSGGNQQGLQIMRSTQGCAGSACEQRRLEVAVMG